MAQHLNRALAALATGIAAAMLCGFAGAPASSHRDAGHHFVFSLPGDWKPIEMHELIEANLNVAGPSGPGQAAFSGGYRPESAKAAEFPFVLVEFWEFPRGRMPVETLEDQMEQNAGLMAEDAVSAMRNVGASLDSQELQIDRERHRMQQDAIVKVPGVGKVHLSSTVGSEAWNSRDLKSRPH